jgi:DMSO/TMAO reductase YedYZ molybdopterin-dependent catalytic subunit
VWAGLLLGLAVSAAAAGVSEQLSVAGAVKTPLTLDVDQLKAFPAAQISTLTVTRRLDGRDVVSAVRGVRLTAILERAALAPADHNDWKHTVVLATASDGYKVAFSWPELFNTEVGTSVLVIFERDGQPLADREGRIALVSARDLQSGPRSVRWLQRVEVKVLPE